ncbi:MAG: carboxymuconolactone decarboxylase family protein [Acidiferrobacterales bacterium]
MPAARQFGAPPRPTARESITMSQLPTVAEAEATGEVAQIYDEIQREMGIPFVPNIDKALAISPNALAGKWQVLRNVFLRTSLPTSLAAMILYTVAAANKCNYCGSIHKVTCRTVGIDEDTLAALDSDLAGLSPRRVQAIVEFAKKCATDRHNLSDADYDSVREQGISDEEIVEIISLAALGNYLDTIADSLKLEVDEAIAQALQG